MTPPALHDWARMSWRARSEWARRAGLTLTDATLAVVRMHAPMRGRPFPYVDGWTDEQHVRSLAGDHDPDVVARRRLEATGLRPTHPDIRRDLPTRSLV